MGDRGRISHGPKRVGVALPLSRGELGPCLTQCGLGRGLLPYQVAWHLHPFSHLATINMGQNWVGAVPFFCGGTWVPSNTVAWAEAYLHTKWHLDPCSRLATIEMGRKLGAMPLLVRGAGSQSSTVWPGPRPTSVPSGILIHPAIWPQQVWAENWKLGGCAPWRGS